MPTPRFRDLQPAAAAAVLNAFIDDDSPVEFTEKLAGQHLTARVRPNGSVSYGIKSRGGSLGEGGYFPDLEEVLEDNHPSVESPVTYEFEVLKRSRRPDYIDYPLKTPITAVELTGAMTPDVAQALSSSQRRVTFLTRGDIRKTVSGLVDDPVVKTKLVDLRDRLASGGRADKAEMMDVESVLMDLVDSGKVPTTLGSKRMEGLFGTSPSTGGFKIPSKAYTDIQVKQAGFYAIVRGHHEREAIQRFSAAVSDPKSDKMVSNVLDYVDYMAAGGPGPGFKVFFSVKESQQLKKLADSYRAGDASAGVRLGKKFFSRVADRESWTSSGIQETTQNHIRINRVKRPMKHEVEYLAIASESLLRSYVRSCVVSTLNS